MPKRSPGTSTPTTHSGDGCTGTSASRNWSSWAASSRSPWGSRAGCACSTSSTTRCSPALPRPWPRGSKTRGRSSKRRLHRNTGRSPRIRRRSPSRPSRAASLEHRSEQVTIEGKTCLITGAAGNLGQAVAKAFAAAGATLILMDVDDKALRSAYGRDDERKLLVRADLLDAASVAQAVAATRSTSTDVLCNIAGGFRMGHPVHETPEDTWELMLDLNAKSVINTARVVVPRMIAAGQGKIVNIAALAGLGGKANMGAYSAAKSAVIRLTESMSADLCNEGINVNCILPIISDARQNRADMPVADPRGLVSPEALAEVVLFLASESARAIHGAAIPVTGLA